MANSLRAKISKLRHDGNITDAEYQELIKKLDGHDAKVRADAIDECIKHIKLYKYNVGTYVLYDETLDEMAERLKEQK